MRRFKTEQDRADELLHEWAGGVEASLGYGYPPAPTPGRVQNSRSSHSAPERYAHDQRRHERLDRAVRRVGEADPRWRGVLWVLYVQRASSTAIIADRMGTSERTCRRWLHNARALFLREFKSIGSMPDDGVADSVSA